jgi:Sulfate permease family
MSAALEPTVWNRSLKVIVPKAMACAMMAGLPVQVGLYTALVPMVIYAVLATSRVLSVSTSTTVAILPAAQLAQVAHSGNPAALLRASAALALLVGAALVLACLVRLDFVADFICEPVLVCFKAGIGLVIYSRAGPENTWHSLRKRDIRSQRSCNRSKPSRNVAGNPGGRRCDDHISADHGAFPAQSASTVAGGSCLAEASHSSFGRFVRCSFDVSISDRHSLIPVLSYSSLLPIKPDEEKEKQLDQCIGELPSVPSFSRPQFSPSFAGRLRLSCR